MNLYVLAINLAHMQKYDDASIAEIFKKYGDHMYQKSDYDNAMEQYIRTIGQLEPSYVIRKVEYEREDIEYLSISFWMHKESTT